MDIKFISGGALGSDSVWSYYGDKHGVITTHFIAEGCKRPTGGKIPERIEEQRSGVVRVVSTNQLHKAIEELINLNVPISGRSPEEFFEGYKEHLSVAQKLHARNYWQVALGEQVLAIGLIQDHKKVSGGTATAVNLAIRLGKPVFVLNTDDCEWYTWNGAAFVKCNKPTFKEKNTTIGTRTMVRYVTLKGGKWINAPYVGESVEKKLREKIQELFN